MSKLVQDYLNSTYNKTVRRLQSEQERRSPRSKDIKDIMRSPAKNPE